jgi:hypothetical protein
MGKTRIDRTANMLTQGDEGTLDGASGDHATRSSASLSLVGCRGCSGLCSSFSSAGLSLNCSSP